MQQQKIWGYDTITTKNQLWMIKNCAGVTPRPSQQIPSKSLFQAGLVVSTVDNQFLLLESLIYIKKWILDML